MRKKKNQYTGFKSTHMDVRSQHKAVIDEIRGRSDEEILLIIKLMSYRVSYFKIGLFCSSKY